MDRYNIFKDKLKENLLDLKNDVTESTMSEQDSDKVKTYQGMYAAYENVLYSISMIEEYIKKMEKHDD